MLIETLRLTHDDCEGYAIQVDGELEFEYYTQYDTLEVANFAGDHMDVLALGSLLCKTYKAGLDAHGQGEVTLKKYETGNLEEYFDFTKGGNE